MDTSLKIGDLATWITGLATILLFVTALWQISIERKSRVERENERLNQRMRGQAEHVSAWIAKESAFAEGWIAILNQSSRPVYEVIVTLVMIQGYGPRDGTDPGVDTRACLSVGPPGQVYAWFRADYHGMQRHPGIEVAFKDASGKNWVRKANGSLIEIEKSPVEYYDLSRPVSWRFPMNEIPPDPPEEAIPEERNPKERNPSQP